LLTTLFEKQAEFQKLVTGETLPKDDVKWFSYHMQAITEELGEVLKSDKRWKTHRNVHYDPENKLVELADVFISCINMALFSGFDARVLYNAIETKIAENMEKLEKGQTNDSSS